MRIVISLLLFFCCAIASHDCVIAQDQILYNRLRQLEKINQISRTVDPGTISSSSSETIIRVFSQEEFNDIPRRLKIAIKTNNSVLIEIGGGPFYFKDVFLNIYNIDNPNLEIRIIGNGTTLIPDGRCYEWIEDHSELNVDTCYLTPEGVYINTVGPAMQAKGEVEILDPGSGLCRVPAHVTQDNSGSSYIRLNEWYLQRTYPVISIEEGYVFFKATDLKFDVNKKCYNVNYDLAVGHVNPRFSLVSMPKRTFRVYECEASQFLVLNNSRIRSFELKGISFVGSTNNKQLLHIRDVLADYVSINNCEFHHIGCDILLGFNAANLLFSENIVENCNNKAVWSRQGCVGTQVISNTFRRTDKRVDATSCISCSSEGFLIKNNVFENFGRTAIAPGIKYSQPKTGIISGIIENNEIFYTKDYLEFMKRYSLIDCGAIHTATQSDGTIIRYNYIHGYGGINSCRSIYCDDGSYNVKIYGNVIIQPDDNYAVFSWRNSGADVKTPLANSGIDFMYNVIWGKYKLEERNDSDCLQGRNVVIYDDEIPKNVLKNFMIYEDDILLNRARIQRNKVKVSFRGKKSIKSLPTYNKISQWVR